MFDWRMMMSSSYGGVPEWDDVLTVLRRKGIARGSFSAIRLECGKMGRIKSPGVYRGRKGSWRSRANRRKHHVY